MPLTFWPRNSSSRGRLAFSKREGGTRLLFFYKPASSAAKKKCELLLLYYFFLCLFVHSACVRSSLSPSSPSHLLPFAILLSRERRPPPSLPLGRGPPGFAAPRLRIVSRWVRGLVQQRFTSYGFPSVWCLPLPGRVRGGRIFWIIIRGVPSVQWWVLVSVLMRLHARNRCHGSLLAAAVDVGRSRCPRPPLLGGISCGDGSPVIRSRAAFLALSFSRCLLRGVAIKELSFWAFPRICLSDIFFFAPYIFLLSRSAAEGAAYNLRCSRSVQKRLLF